MTGVRSHRVRIDLSGTLPRMDTDHHEPPFDGLGDEPRCPVCGTVMHAVDGAYECRWCGHREELPWVERPVAGDDLAGISGG